MKKEPIMMDGAQEDCRKLLDLSDQACKLMPGCLRETVMYKVVNYPNFVEKLQKGRVSPHRMKRAEISLIEFIANAAKSKDA